ncbi:uncharacterized protein LOC133523219 [Cydia pomonella]|uniref:uncharacterized protein LOC133523219 n=1 Tax=Cydia pomonella TaxID=82600 RepID=UPI002ADD7AF7|nr:uncharacterized protein LOC133523219 [Cydia pomonella]
MSLCQIVISIFLLFLAVGYSTDNLDTFNTEIDDIFSSVIGPVFDQKTPHPISNNTLTNEPRMLKIRTLNPSLLKSLDDEIPKKPMLNPQRQNYAKTPQRTRNYAQSSIRTRNYAITHKKYSTPQAPMPHSKIQVLNEEDTEDIYKELYKNPENKLELEQMLEQPIQTKPDFKQDVFNETTRRFNQLYDVFQKWTDETKSLNISRRQMSTTTKYPYRRDPPEERVQLHNEIKLKALAQHHNITNHVPFELVDLATKLYYRDRRALERALTLMAQFIYGAQYKFIYAQNLKERYATVTTYQIGYSIAVLKNLKHQYYSGYFAMAQFRRTKVQFTYEDEVMYLIKVYERLLRIRVEFNEVVNYVRALEFERKRREALRVETEGQKDRYFIG